MIFSDRKPWYVGKHLPGVGYPVKARTFIDQEDEHDFIRAVCSDEETAHEIVDSHNASAPVRENVARVRRNVEESDSVL